MSITDIITILLPISLEGIIIFLFQLFINKKIDRIDKKMEVKSDVIVSFFEQVKNIGELQKI